MAQTARDLDVYENLLRKWGREATADPQQAFPGHGVAEPGNYVSLIERGRNSPTVRLMFRPCDALDITHVRHAQGRTTPHARTGHGSYPAPSLPPTGKPLQRGSLLAATDCKPP